MDRAFRSKVRPSLDKRFAPKQTVDPPRGGPPIDRDGKPDKDHESHAFGINH